MVSLAIGTLMFSLIILQSILPLFKIWIFEKEIVFLFVAFVGAIVYITKRYYFS